MGKIKFGLKQSFGDPIQTTLFQHCTLPPSHNPLMYTKNASAALLSPFSSQSLMWHLGKKKEFSGKGLSSG